MLVVITKHSAVVSPMQIMVDIGQVVSGDPTLGVNPHLAPQLAVASLAPNAMGFIDDFCIRHDLYYHA